MQFAKMDVPEEYMATNDEELVLKMEQVSVIWKVKTKRQNGQELLLTTFQSALLSSSRNLEDRERQFVGNAACYVPRWACPERKTGRFSIRRSIQIGMPKEGHDFMHKRHLRDTFSVTGLAVLLFGDMISCTGAPRRDTGVQQTWSPQ